RPCGTWREVPSSPDPSYRAPSCRGPSYLLPSYLRCPSSCLVAVQAGQQATSFARAPVPRPIPDARDRLAIEQTRDSSERSTAVLQQWLGVASGFSALIWNGNRADSGPTSI